MVHGFPIFLTHATLVHDYNMPFHGILMGENTKIGQKKSKLYLKRRPKTLKDAQKPYYLTGG
jgi:hypothetical protein